jgi:hypothetical protein
MWQTVSVREVDEDAEWQQLQASEREREEMLAQGSRRLPEVGIVRMTMHSTSDTDGILWRWWYCGAAGRDGQLVVQQRRRCAAPGSRRGAGRQRDERVRPLRQAQGRVPGHPPARGY